MEAAALEQTLREHPDDAAAWMVYGDWLLEQGDVRGALIQLEHRHARAREADRAALRREIDALVKQHQKRWKASLPRGVAGQSWRYGFATKVAVTWSEDAPAQIRGVRRLHLQRNRITAEGAAALRRFDRPGDDRDSWLDAVDPALIARGTGKRQRLLWWADHSPLIDKLYESLPEREAGDEGDADEDDE